MLDNGDRALIVARLRARRRDGNLTGHDVRLAAEVFEVSTSTMYRWISRDDMARARRPHYELTHRDKLAYFMACGCAALAYQDMLQAGEGAPPSLSTYQRALNRDFDSGTRDAASVGARGRKQLRIALKDREYRRNERWEGDHTQLDIEVMVPRRKKPMRPWLTWVEDAATRYVGGWAISLRPTRGEVLSVLRVAVEHSPQRGPLEGVPKVLVWDNGLEFTARAVTECALMLGSYVYVAPPYKPERKGKIERLHQTLEREVVSRLPFYTKGPRKADGTLYGPIGGHITLEALVAQVAIWIDHYNFDRPHSSLAGKSPAEVWEADATPIRQVKVEDLRRLTLERRNRNVTHEGVEIDRRKFAAAALNAYVGERVEVGLMPHDYSRAEIFSLDGEWICTARPSNEFSPEEIREHQEAIKELNRESALLLTQRTKLLRERFASMTPDDPIPRSLPPDPALRIPANALADPLDFGDSIGEVD